MNPTSEAISKIQSHVAGAAYDWTLSDQELADAINADLVANPASQGQVPKDYTMADILNEVSNRALGKIRSEGGITEIVAAVRQQNAQRVLMWAGSYLRTGDITQAEYDAIQATVTDTVPDPDYNSQVPWPEKNLGRKVDADDIAQSRP